MDRLRPPHRLGAAAAALALVLAACTEAEPPAPRSTGSPSASPDRITAESRVGAPAGKWYRAPRGDANLNAEQRARIAALEATGYAAGGEEAGELEGVTLHDRERAAQGVNFFVSGHGQEALLVDMEGRELHAWRCDAQAAWPELEVFGPGFWRKAKLLEDGAVLAMFENVGLAKLDRDSQLEWAYAEKVHHDVDVDAAGRVYVLGHEAYIRPWVHPERPVLDDFIAVLSPEGEELERISLVECVENSPLREELQQRILATVAENLEQEARILRENAALIEKDPSLAAKLDLAGNVFHTNRIQLLDGSLEHLSPHYAAGHALISIRNQHMLAILDLEARSLVWYATGSWRGQHEPVLLEDGRMLLFDNNGLSQGDRKGWSRVMELAPQSGEIVWSYQEQDPFRFYSNIAGSCQRLANGNTLVTESTTGRAFEVTRGGEVVWEFYNPYRAGEQRELVAFLPELRRFPLEFVHSWLPDAGAAPDDR